MVESPRATAPVHARRAGFTIIELLVVVAVISLLTTLVAISGPVVYETHRKLQTQSTMRVTELAIDQFAELDPLRSTYNSPSRKSFGSYPAYTIFSHEKAAKASAVYIQKVVESDGPYPSGIKSSLEYTLRGRMARDMFGGNVSVNKLESNTDDLLVIDDDGGYEYVELQRTYDDMRSLYAYLATFVPDALELIPESSRVPLSDNPNLASVGEFIDPSGTGQLDGRIPIQGIVDAWGVPLDYSLMFKLRYTIDNDGLAGWTVVDRRPVLRSQGVSLSRMREIIGNNKFGSTAANNLLREATRDRWIFSQPMPSNAMSEDAIDNPDGKLNKPDTNSRPGEYDGWVRCVAGVGDEISDSYAWLPVSETN